MKSFVVVVLMTFSCCCLSAEEYPVSGTLSAKSKTEITADVSGRVTEVLVSVGDLVKKGDPLARLDATGYERELKNQQIVVELAKVAQKEAQRNFERMEKLFSAEEKGPATIPKKQFEEAELALHRAHLGVKQALLRLDQIKGQVEDTTIKAPYDGVITKTHVGEGDAISTMPATALFQIMDLSELTFKFSIPQNMIGRVVPGLELKARVAGYAEEMKTVVKRVDPSLDEASRSVMCQAVITNDAHLSIRPGCFATGTIEVGE